METLKVAVVPAVHQHMTGTVSAQAGVIDRDQATAKAAAKDPTKSLYCQVVRLLNSN